jgi:hypothetical protein
MAAIAELLYSPIPAWQAALFAVLMFYVGGVSVGLKLLKDVTPPTEG